MPIISKTAIAALCAIGGLTLLPAAAFADIENGTYSGTTAAGQTIGFTVVADPNDSSQHVVTGYNWGFTDDCKGGTTLSGGWGTGSSTGTPIKSGRVTLVNSAPYLYVDMVVKIVAGGTATGKITTADPTLTPLNGTARPKKTLYCSSKPMTFTATISVPAETSAVTQGQGTVPMGRFTLKQ